MTTILQPRRSGTKGGDDNSEERKLLPFSVINGQNMTRDDFLVIRNAGFAVDDDN